LAFEGFFVMQTQFVELDQRLLSPKLWRGFAPPVGGVFPDQASGNDVRGLFDDFENFGAVSPLATATTYFQSNGNSYIGYNDATVVPTAAAVPSTTPSVSENGPGVIVMQSDTTANDIAILQAGSGTMMPFHVNPARMQELAFECRFKVSAITASCSDIFIGLAGTGACADSGVFTDAGALASNNFLGFTRLGTQGSAMSFGYQRVGGTAGTRAGVLTLAADTYIKAGFRYHAARKQCSIWMNGEEVATARIGSAITGATPWPSLYMNFCAAINFEATAAHQLYVDWWACAQLL
jgi:hypothetical protein